MSLRLFQRCIQCADSVSFRFLPGWNICVRSVVTDSPASKVGLPDPPKKPRPSYILFLQEIRPKVVQESPQLAVSGELLLQPDVFREIGSRWRALSAEEKAVYKEKANRERQQYLKRINFYLDKIGWEGCMLLRSAEKIEMERRLEEKEAKQIRKDKKQLGRPKKPPSVFSMFVKHTQASGGDIGKGRAAYKLYREAYYRAPEEDKEVFVAEYRRQVEKYKQAMEEWEAKMLKKGRVDLLRKTTRSLLLEKKWEEPRKEQKRKTSVVSPKFAIKSKAGSKTSRSRSVAKSKVRPKINPAEPLSMWIMDWES